MPPVIFPNNGGPGYKLKDTKIVEAMKKNFVYEYPERMKLHPKTEFHKVLLEMVMTKAQAAYSRQQERKDAWDTTDKTLQAYIDLTEEEQKLKEKKPRSPVGIVVPYSYAAMETILTYLTMAFLNQQPILQLESVSTEDTIAVKQLEILIQRHMDYYKGALSLHTMMRDGLAYGIGAVAPIWRRDYRWLDRPRSVVEKDLSGQDVTRQASSRSYETVFEGTDMESIGPRNLLLDPQRSAHKMQQGEYAGWTEITNLYRLLELERANKGWFNCKHLYEAGPTASIFNPESISSTDTVSKPVNLVHMYFDVIPAEYKMPPAPGNDKGLYPEKWLITVADDWCIVRLERMNASHGKYAMVVNAPDYDGYDAFPLARLEIISGLQHTLNWLFNSHISNARKVINNTLVVDPEAVELNDVKMAREGGIIRLKSSPYAKSAKDAVYQLDVHDVTANNIPNAGAVIDMMQRVSAATDNLMGLMRNQGERVSATESRTVATSAMNRLEKLARIISIQAFQDLGMICATNIQDYMQNEVRTKVLGNWPTSLLKELGGVRPGDQIVIDPNKLVVPFDVVVRDGSLPIDTAGVANSWIQLFGYITGNELLLQKFDSFRIFLHIARLLGAKDINEFELSGSVMPDEQLAKEREKGNVVSVKEMADAKAPASN